jgi:hypothetical protein
MGAAGDSGELSPEPAAAPKETPEARERPFARSRDRLPPADRYCACGTLASAWRSTPWAIATSGASCSSAR